MKRMTSDRHGRNCMLNKAITFASVVATSCVMFYMRLYVEAVGYAAFAATFPVFYVLLKFKLSNCINKDAVMEEGFGEWTVMLFEDSSKNIKTSDFVESEALSANFWIVIVSFLASFCAITFR